MEVDDDNAFALFDSHLTDKGERKLSALPIQSASSSTHNSLNLEINYDFYNLKLFCAGAVVSSLYPNISFN